MINYLIFIDILYLFLFYILIKEKQVFFIFFIVINVEMIFSYINFSYNLIPYLWDAKGYIEASRDLYNYYINQSSYFPDWSLSNKSMGYLLLIINFFDGNPFIKASILNIFFSNLSILLLYKVFCYYILDKKDRLYLILFLSLIPTHFLMSFMVTREPILWFLSSFILYCIFNIYHKKYKMDLIHKIICYILIIISIYCMIFFRFFYILPFISIVLLFLSRKVILTTAVFSIFILMFTEQLNNYIRIANYMMQYRTCGGAAYLVGMKYNSIFDMIIYLPIRFIYYTFGPMPWDIRNIFLFLTFLESSVYIYIVGYFFIKRKRFVLFLTNNKFMLFIFFYIIIGLSIGSLGDSNYGTAMRHRIQYVIFFIIIYFSFKNYLKVLNVWNSRIDK